MDGVVKLGVPLHNLQALTLFGNVMVSPGALNLCAEAGVSVTFLSESGQLMARVDAPVSGNVLLRRESILTRTSPGNALVALMFCRRKTPEMPFFDPIAWRRLWRQGWIPTSATCTSTAGEAFPGPRSDGGISADVGRPAGLDAGQQAPDCRAGICCSRREAELSRCRRMPAARCRLAGAANRRRSPTTVGTDYPHRPAPLSSG